MSSQNGVSTTTSSRSILTGNCKIMSTSFTILIKLRFGMLSSGKMSSSRD